MKTISFNIPEYWMLTDFQIKMLFASNLYKVEKITKEQAAEIVGCTKQEFDDELEKVGEYKVYSKE